MNRWALAAVSALVAAAAAVSGTFWLWGQRAQQLPTVETRVLSLQGEISTLAAEKRDLEQRVEQINKEQERLAQENSLLRTQLTNQQLLAEQHGIRPAPTIAIPK